MLPEKSTDLMSAKASAAYAAHLPLLRYKLRKLTSRQLRPVKGFKPAGSPVRLGSPEGDSYCSLHSATESVRTDLPVPAEA